jgi:hypothetical protein
MTNEILDLVFNSLGIIGVTLIIVTFYLIQSGKITSSNMVYPVGNLIGAVLHLISLYRFYNLASVIIELFWIAISLYGIAKIKMAKN